MLVERDIVLSMVRRFGDTNTNTCSDYRPEQINNVFLSLQISYCDPYSGAVFVDYDSAQKVLDKYECPKISAMCNSWTKWMRHDLKLHRCRPLADEAIE